MTENAPSTARAPRGYDLEIRQLKDRAVRMGQWALAMFHDGWRAYDQGDLAAAQAVLDRDTELDQFDEDMEHATIAFLVLRQPAAVDLRTAAALLKITTHLDRVGRLGFDMARIATSDPPPEPAELRTLLQRMDETVESMVAQALDALDHDRVEGARELFRRDDQVDRMHREANRMIVSELEKNPAAARRLAGDLLVARHFERIADNACKVGEKTIYALTGQRRSEYLPRHPFRPYVLETPQKGGEGRRGDRASRNSPGTPEPRTPPSPGVRTRFATYPGTGAPLGWGGDERASDAAGPTAGLT
ncbi:MAG: phosphate signaling complex protein PhoU [Thermoplasmata archaeon]|nr:phosphate signaling complex protein PhoU [Thermoplasmata archaeon]